MAFSNRTRVCYSLAVWALSGTSRTTAFSLSTTTSPSINRQVLINRSFSSSSVLRMSEQQTDVAIQANLDEVISRIESACKEAGRATEDVRLVAVSKTKPLELLKQA
jgi:molecular chaperone DnaK (HSP70)